MEKNYKNALKYLEETIKLKELREFDKNINPEYSISFIYLYIALNDINKALEHILFFFENNKENINYWFSCLAVAKVLGYYSLNKEQNEKLNNITKFTKLEKDAEVYFREVIEKAEKNNYLIVLISALLEYGKYLYLRKDDPKKALSMINRSKEIAKNHRLKGRLREIKNVIDEIINKKSDSGG